MGIFSRKFKRHAKETGKFISAIAAATIFTMPSLGHAQNITKADAANANTIISNGNVHEIYADEYSAHNAAINHFSNFQLDAQNIANMHFGQQGGIDAATLINLVDSRADINGIVNAVRDGTIGGNLYFISSQGIAVGAEGVINAGQIGLIVPTDSYYQNLISNKGNISVDNFSADKIRNGEIPLNVSGTISVAGKLNATDGINLASTNIDIQNTAQLQSVRTINYSDYVNVSDEVKAGLDPNNLTVTKNEAGEIVIAAAIDSKNLGMENNFLDTLGLNYTRLAAPNSATVNVAEGAKINSDSNVDIRAMANSDIDIDLGKTTAVGTFLSLQSKVNVDGEVTGNNVNISAKTNDNYKFNAAVTGDEEHAIDLGVDENTPMDQTLIGIYDGAKEFLNVPTLLHKLHISAAFVGHNNSADVKIGDKAVITATGTDSDNPALNISSAGIFNADLKASNVINGSLPALGFTFSYSGNTADVDIGGKLDAKQGSLAVTSNANTDFSTDSTIDATKRSGSAVTLVTNLLLNGQGSNVNLSSNAKLNAAENISVTSTSNSPTDVIAEVKNDSGGLGALSVNYVSQTDDAKINTDAQISAGGKVDINAEKTAPTYKVLSNIATDKPDLLSQVKAYTGDVVKNIVDGATKRANEKNSNDNSSATENTGSYITTNANIAIETSNAKINVGKNSAINAGGNVTVTSKVNFGDPEVGALNVSSSDFVGQKDTVAISPAVNFIKSTNDSVVIFEGDAQIKGNDVAIKSEFESNNVRFAKARQDLLDSGEEIKNIFSADNLADKKEVVGNFFESLTDLSAADVAAFVTQGADISQTLNNLRTKLDEKTKFLDEYHQKINSAANQAQAEQLLQQVGAKYPNVDLNEMKDSLFKNAEDILSGGDASKVTAKIDNLKDSFSKEIATIETAINRVDTICDTAKVANYYADKEQVAGQKTSNSQQTGLALAGTVNVGILNNSAQVLIGKNISIDAENNVEIASDLTNNDIAVSGHIKPQTSAASALNLIVNAYIANDDNILAIAENNSISGKNISVAGKNYVNHILFADGSGAAPDSRSRASGTVNYGGGESLTLLSIDDEINFKTDGNVDVTAENKANLLNIAGGLAYASGAANAGASIAINNFNVQTLGAISNNDIDETSELVKQIHEKVDAEKLFGTSDVEIEGKLSAENLKVNAHSDGTINSLSIAGSLSTNGDSNNDNKNGSSADSVDDTATVDNASDIGANIPDFNQIIAYVQKYFELDDNAANSDNAASDNANVLTKSVRKIDASQKSDKGSTTQTSTNENSPVKNEKPSEVNTPKANDMVDSKSMPSFTISGAGSASVNLASNRTVAGIEIKKVDVVSEVESKAVDDTFIGAWSGAGALNFRNYKASDSSKSKSSSSTNVGMSGAVGLNIIDANVTSQIKNTSVLKNTSAIDSKVKELETVQSQLEKDLADANSALEKANRNYIYVMNLSRSTTPPSQIEAARSALNNAKNRVNTLKSEIQKNSSAIQSAKAENTSATIVTNNAEKSGAIIAAAPSLAIQHNSGESANNYSGAASVSINIVENNVAAEILNSDIDAKSLTNTAQNVDTQVTGGINIATATGGSSGIALGGSVALAHIQNKVDAKIDGGTYKLSDSLKNLSTGSVTQVVGAVGVSVAKGSSSSYGFQGVFGYNRADNKNYATISNTNITANDIENISADNKDAAKKFDSFLSSAGIDATGQSYADESNIANADSSQNAGKQQTSNAGTVEEFDANKSAEKTKTTNYGNKVITGAFALAGAGDGAAMASIAISDVDNDFVSTINGGTIKTDSTATDAIKISAVSNTLDINAAAGAAISSKGFGAGGSVSWQTTDNNVVAGIGATENSNNTTLENVRGVDIDAETGALEVNVAGQLSGGKGTALGLAMAYNALNDTTDAFIKNVTSTGKGTELAINSTSNGSVYAVGAGVGVSTNSAALGGSIAINRGANSTLAKIENSNISNAGNISVDAQDKVNKLAVVGNLQISGGSAAIGGAVAYNDIGASTSDKQKTSASILNSNIANSNNSVSVNAVDESELTTIGVGVGIAGKGAAVQGAVAVATINKDVDAKVSGSTINLAGTPKISAQSTEDITTSADVISVNAGTGAAIGAGVAINNDKTNTLAELNTSTVNSNGLEITSSNNSGIVNVGIGASGGGTGAAVTGSVAVNNIGTKTLTNVTDSTINSTGDENVLVDSQSDELISNYAGSISFAGTGAAVGVSVSVNNITSETSSNVKGGSITLNRVDDNYKNLSVKNYIAPEAFADKSFTKIFTGSNEKVGSGQVDAKGNKVDSNGSSETSEKVSGIFKAKSGLEQQRRSVNYRGIVINSSGSHTLQSLMINGGVAGTGAAVNGTVDINLVDGKTAANVDGTKLNTNAADDVNILANDYTKSRGVVGTANAALTGAAVGLGNDSQDIARKVDATYIGRNDKDVSTNNFNIQANNLQGMNSLIAGISAAITGAGVSNSTGVYLMEGATNASLENANVSTKHLNINSYHDAQINTFGAAVGIAGLGAGVGLGVDVLREVDTTTVDIKNTTVNFKSEESLAYINALNNITLNYEVYDIGAGAAGLAGAVGVSNILNEVGVNIENSNLGGNGTKPTDININAMNFLDFGNKAFAGAAGLGGIGAGVTVTTIDGKVNTNIDNSTLQAKRLVIGTEEYRNVKQTSGSTSAGVGAISANVMVTSIGAELESTYRNESNSNDDGSTVNIDENIGKANKGTSENNSAIDKIGDGENNPTKSLGINAPKVTANKGGASNSGVSTTISNSKLSGEVVDISNQANNSVAVTGYTASIGGVALGGGVGILNVNKNSALNLENTSIDAVNALNVRNISGGTSALNTYQGSAGGIALNVSYSKLKSSGVDDLNIIGSNLKAAKDISIENADRSSTGIKAIGIASGLGAGGVLIAEGTTTGNNKIFVNNATLTSDNGSVNIIGNANNKLDIETVSKSAAVAFAGSGIVAVGKENSAAEIEIDNNTNISAATDIYISSQNNSGADTKTSADSTSLLAAKSGTYLENNLETASKINIGNNTKLNSNYVTIESLVSPTQNLKMTSLSVGSAGIGVSAGKFNTNTTNTVEIGNIIFKDGADVAIVNSTSPTQTASVAGLNVGLIASGTQAINANSQFNASTKLGGTESNANISVQADIISKPTVTANGDGGGLVDLSPYAAMINDTTTMDSVVDVGGTWKAKSISIVNENTDGGEFKAEATRATVEGASAVLLNRNTTANATINFEDGTDITTEGRQNYSAKNTMAVSETLNASGYGGLNANAAAMGGNLNYKAAINIGDGNSTTKFKSTKDNAGIYFDALTGGELKYRNTLNSTGVASLTVAYLMNNADIDNSINVNKADFTTLGSDSDITFGASEENVMFDFADIANLNAGLGGVVSSTAYSNLTRSHKINLVNTNIDSARDINIFTDANANNNESYLTMSLLSDAYNRTAIPLSTSPSLTNKMTQENKINIDADSNLLSSRNINLQSTAGESNIVESSREFNFYKGTSGKLNMISTANGDTAGLRENQNNTLNIDGTLKAGKHNVLDILIENTEGTTSENSKVVTVNVDGASPLKIRLSVNKGDEVVDVNKIQAGSNVELTNPFIEEYNSTKKAMQDYPTNSQQYKDLQAYLNGIADSMVTYGFAEKTSSGYTIHEKITRTVIDIPEFALSGGDIKISADKLSGTGSLTARSAIGATIKNTSPLPLRINNIDMDNAGGYVSFNGNILNNDGYNFKELDMDGNFETPPTFEITHSGKKYGTLRPDIYVDGDINDSAGKVKLTDENGSVIVRGNILATGGVDIITPNGGFMLNNTKENFNLLDPMAKYTFGNEDVANALQKYIAIKGSTTNFASYDDYLNTIFGQITDAVKTATGGSTDRDTWKANIKKLYGDKDASAEPDTSIVTNGPINITAKYINVNGLIQSGFTNYTGTVDSSKVTQLNDARPDAAKAYQSFQSKLSDILSLQGVLLSEDFNLLKQMKTSSYEELVKVLQTNSINNLEKYLDDLTKKYYDFYDRLNGLRFTDDLKLISSLSLLKTQAQKLSSATAASTLKDSEAVGNEKYLVTSNTNKVWNSSTKMYDGAVNVYYNPVTKNLLTEDINVNGGYVRLKGTVVSTGGGRIVSAKGGADIFIDTREVNNPIHLGAINNNDRQGVVIIDDTSKGLQTFTRNSTYTPDNYAFGWTGGVNYRQTSKCNLTESGNIFELFARAVHGFTKQQFDQRRNANNFFDFFKIKFDFKEVGTYVKKVLDKSMNTSQVSRSAYGNPVSLKELTRGAFIQKINDASTWNNIKNNNLYTSTSRSAPFNVKNYNLKDGWKIDTKWEFWETPIRFWRDWNRDEEYSATSTYYIPANKSISIETPTANNGGKININSKGNIYVDGNINNPVSGSSIDIMAEKGSIETKNNSVIQSDYVNFIADKDIKANLKGTNGDVRIWAQSQKGNVTINTPDNLGTGGITALGNSITLNAGGNIVTRNPVDINARIINLTSERGNISVNIDPRNQNDNMAQIKATAQGDITLVEVNGDLYIDKVESKNGNVSITANNGNILDGTGQTYELSDSTNRLQRWIDAGIISNDDSDDSAELAASEQKAVVIEGLAQRAKTLAANSSNPEERLQLYADLAQKFAASKEMQNAKTFYAYSVKNSKDINQTDSHDVDAANNTYQELINSTDTYKGDKYRAEYLNKIKKFFAGTNLTAEEMALVSDYAWAESGEDYGFSKNQLLYAIQDGILNSTPGQTVNVKNPNIIGNNITLNATNGGIGNDDESAQTINAADLNKFENLQLLSTLKAGDLTWDKNGNAIIRRQHPVSLEIKNNDSANLSVSTKNQIYLVGTKNTTFNFSKFEHDTSSNVRLMTGEGIFTNGDTIISAKDLIAYGGFGNVGTKENPLKVNLAGSLDANSGDSVYISSVGENNLTIQAIAATNDVNLQSIKDMLMTTETGKTGGYIRGKNISLSVDKGSVDGWTLDRIRTLEKYVESGIKNIDEARRSGDRVDKILLPGNIIQLRVNVQELKKLYSNIQLASGIGVANDGLRIYSDARQISSAPHVTINAGGAIINNDFGTSRLYFDSITAPYGFGLNVPNKAGFSDSSFSSRLTKLSNFYKQGWQKPTFKYTLTELDSIFQQY